MSSFNTRSDGKSLETQMQLLGNSLLNGIDLSRLLERKEVIEFDRSDPSHAYDRVNWFLNTMRKKSDTQQLS